MLFIISLRRSYPDLLVFDVKFGIYVTRNDRFGIDDLLQLNLDEVVEGFNVLFDKSLYFEKSRQ